LYLKKDVSVLLKIRTGNIRIYFNPDEMGESVKPGKLNLAFYRDNVASRSTFSVENSSPG